MSFGFSVGDFLTFGALALALSEAFASAPEEFRSLSADLDILHGLIGQFERDASDPESPLSQCSTEKRVHLESILQRIGRLLGDLSAIRERFQSLNGQPRVLDRLRYPRAEIRLIKANLHLQISALKLFLASLTTAVVGRILDVLEDQNKLALANWATVLGLLAERGITEEAAEPHREQLEEHVQAIHEVAESERELSSLHSGTGESVASDPTSRFGSDGISGLDSEQDHGPAIGPPSAAHLVSRVCEGGLRLQEGRPGGIRQRKNWISSVFGATKYKVECRKCHFVGFQDEKLDDLINPTNTPLFFTHRRAPLTNSSIEYYLDIHTKHRGEVDGIYYRTMFFWKCHVPAATETRHNEGQYECPFCPFDRAAGVYFNRLELLDHVLISHVQNQPPEDLRLKFNCWIEDSTALFEQQHANLRGRKFDLLLPRPYSTAEGTLARLARDRSA